MIEPCVEGRGDAMVVRRGVDSRVHRWKRSGRGGGQVDTSRRGRGSAGLVAVCGGRDQIKCIPDTR